MMTNDSGCIALSHSRPLAIEMNGARNYMCPQCARMCKSEEALKAHRKNAHRNKGRCSPASSPNPPKVGPSESEDASGAADSSPSSVHNETRSAGKAYIKFNGSRVAVPKDVA